MTGMANGIYKMRSEMLSILWSLTTKNCHTENVKDTLIEKHIWLEL